jgi:hypothetical protein
MNNGESTPVTSTEDQGLERRRTLIEVETLLQKAAKKGLLGLDNALVEKLVARKERINLSYLVEYKKGGGDPNLHLQTLANRLEGISIEEEKVANRLINSAKMLIEDINFIKGNPAAMRLVDRALLEGLGSLLSEFTPLIPEK